MRVIEQEGKMNILNHKNSINGEFSGALVVTAQHFHCQGPGMIPGRGTKVLQHSHIHTQEKA